MSIKAPTSVTRPRLIIDERAYQRLLALAERARIPEYWILDLDARLLERWRPNDERPEILTDSLDWRPGGAPEPLVIDLGALFAAVLDR